MFAVFALWLSASGVLDAGCAGDLKDPDRFDEIVQRATSAGASGKSSSYAAGAGGGAAGQAGSSGGSSGTTISPAPECVTTLFAKSCASSSICHAAGAMQLDLVSSNVEKRLVGVDASSSSACAGKKLIATDGSSSLLLDKLQDDTLPCGSRMPLGGTPVSADELKCVSDWVETVSMSAVGGP